MTAGESGFRQSSDGDLFDPLGGFERVGKLGILVPSTAPIELRTYVAAAATAYYLGYRSIDYILKQLREMKDPLISPDKQH